MKKILNILFFLAAPFGCCLGQTVFPQSNYVIRVVSGPSVSVPGLTPITVSLDNPKGTVSWMLGSYEGSEAGAGQILSITAPGDYYAEDIHSCSFTPPPGEECTTTSAAGHVVVDALQHSLNLQMHAGFQQICFTTNYNSFNISWSQDGDPIGPITDNSCIDISSPGSYIATVTYFYGNASSTLQVGPIVVPPDPLAPRVEVFSVRGPETSYNPVTPPLLQVINPFDYSILDFFGNGQTLYHGPSSFSTNTVTTTGPGGYRVSGMPNSGLHMVSTNKISLPKGDIPVPPIVASQKQLTYAQPTLQLSIAQGYSYNQGYTWYFNDQVIAGQTGPSLKVDEPGPYKVQGCAIYPDGTTQCKTSEVFQVTGETQFVNVASKCAVLTDNITDFSQVLVLSTSQALTSVNYLDGLARPLQTVQQFGSPGGNDLIAVNEYDNIGREAKKNLPFTHPPAGAYMALPRALQKIGDFYQKDNDHVADTDFPFAETVFESSPLNRVLTQGSAGEDWQIDAGHPKSIDYLNNVASDNVLIWNKTVGGPVAAGFYPNGMLTITQVTDEDGHTSREYKDKLGQVVLSEKIIEGGVKLRTYFVFDDLSRLAYVIPPKTVAALPVSASVGISSDVLARECFSYQYDQRSRVIVKGIPGGGLIYSVYDKWDRVVLTQHANQRVKNKWSFNKYDAFNRVILTGEIILAGDQTVATLAVNSFYANVSGNPSLRYEESGGTLHGYTNRSFPVLSNPSQVYTVAYFDNYNFLSQFGAGYQFTAESALGLSAGSTHTQSLLTGAKMLVLGTSTYLKSVHFYDDKHRLIQLMSDNYQGGIDRVSSSLDFVGRVLKTKEIHNGLQPVTVEQEFVYDNVGRKLKAYHTINGGAKVLLCDYHYNELGQMIEKNLHSTDGNTFLQSEDYVYNIRGWLSQMNPAETESNVSFPDQYGFDLSYTNTSTPGLTDFQPAFNGNIAAYTEVQSAIDDTGVPVKNGYSYHYDIRNQLIKASYYQLSNPAKNGQFDMPVISYDPNGNIRTLQRKGIKGNGTPGLIDDLQYLYDGNQLIRVNEQADPAKGFMNQNK